MENNFLKWVLGKNLEELKLNIINFKDKHLIINILGENETNKENIMNFQKEYFKLINFIHNEKLNAMISIKPTQLGLGISVMYFYKIFDPIIELLHIKNIKVCIDMEDIKYYEKTLIIAEKYIKIYKNLIRVAIQCEIKTSYEDCKKILDLGGSVRLCRGAYKNSQFTKQETEENLLKCIELVKQYENKSSLASHSLHDKELDMECLYGYLENYDNYNSIYIPYGERWLNYCKRREPDKF